MLLRQIPLAHPEPDAGHFIDILMGRAGGSRPPLIEYLVSDVLQRPIMEKLLGRTWAEPDGSREATHAYLDNFIELWYRLGYDFVRYEQGLRLPRHQLVIDDTAAGADRQRVWADEHHGVISTWEDFERYPWPKVEEADFSAFEYLSKHLPEGMGLIVSHGGGVFEHLWGLMSYEGLCVASLENPELVQAVADRLGELMVGFYRQVLEIDRIIAVFPGDDLGFRTGTLLSPAALRRFILPWHKRFATIAHEHGLPYFLHSCGNMRQIMEDLIEDVKLDGKHSFEDAIIPVQDFQALYGERIAVLGGMDIDLLGSGSAEAVREHAHFLLETCGRRGRFALGSGSSIASYIPLENYLAMVDEAVDFKMK